LLASTLMGQTKLTYPDARRSGQMDTYFGDKVADPYRWLEDTDSPETAAWVQAENKVTFSYLDQIPEREKIRRKITALYDYERYAAPQQVNGRYFYTHNTGLQNQNIFFVQDGLTAQARVLIDPNTLSSDGTAAVDGFVVNKDATLAAYALAQAGSDWSIWKIRDVKTGADRTDILRWTKFSSIAWLPDSSAFYYARYPEPTKGSDLTQANQNEKVYLHTLGDEQSKDRLIYERNDQPDLHFAPTISDDGRYLVIYTSSGASEDNGLLLMDLQDSNPRFRTLVDQIDAKYSVIGNQGSVFYLLTNKQAPMGRVIGVDIQRARANLVNAPVIVPEGKELLSEALMVSNQLVLGYLKDAHSVARAYSLDGKLMRDIPMPGLGTAAWSSARQTDKELFFTYADFTTPTALYRYDVASGKIDMFRSSKLNFDNRQFEARQVFYPSKDGTRIPMFLIYKKGLKLDGQNPTILYGYGGFNIPLVPAFHASVIGWLQMGGLYAVANLRGGSEYGEEWHKAGTKLQKQNVFDDFAAAAHFLIDQHFTSTPKLAIDGRSNGGLLVGAVLNQNPGLFGAAFPGVGVMDMLRFQKFTVGNGWISDYGSSDNPEEYKALRAYSPLHNIREGVTYPPTFIVTADHDDRVVPGHSFKYAATLQRAQAGDAPVLIRIETKAGHGGGKPVSKQIDEVVDQYAFLVKSLGVKVPD
jgi:prolyl oligopeptidase